jgi:hypothetical protein
VETESPSMSHVAILFIWFGLVVANVEIIEKTNEKIVQVHLGEARIRNGYYKIVQSTNIENLGTLTSRIKATAEKYLQGFPTTLNIIKDKCEIITRRKSEPTKSSKQTQESNNLDRLGNKMD